MFGKFDKFVKEDLDDILIEYVDNNYSYEIGVHISIEDSNYIKPRKRIRFRRYLQIKLKPNGLVLDKSFYNRIGTLINRFTKTDRSQISIYNNEILLYIDSMIIDDPLEHLSKCIGNSNVYTMDNHIIINKSHTSINLDSILYLLNTKYNISNLNNDKRVYTDSFNNIVANIETSLFNFMICEFNDYFKIKCYPK